MHKKRLVLLIGATLLASLLAMSYPVYHYVILSGIWSDDVMEFIRQPDRHPDWMQPELTQCGSAPFLFPTRGFIGFLWDISFYPLHRHQGIDIFGGTEPGTTPVYAVADGYLTRESDWKSSIILRIPEDPIHPDQQVWVYYTHLAMPDGTSTISAEFPAGITEEFIQSGTLLGYQGNYSGTPGSPTGVHLHLSIVKDDGHGHYLNELKIKNTIDPTPYFGIPLNAASFPKFPVHCP